MLLAVLAKKRWKWRFLGSNLRCPPLNYKHCQQTFSSQLGNGREGLKKSFREKLQIPYFWSRVPACSSLTSPASKTFYFINMVREGTKGQKKSAYIWGKKSLNAGFILPQSFRMRRKRSRDCKINSWHPFCSYPLLESHSEFTETGCKHAKLIQR